MAFRSARKQTIDADSCLDGARTPAVGLVMGALYAALALISFARSEARASARFCPHAIGGSPSPPASEQWVGTVGGRLAHFQVRYDRMFGAASGPWDRRTITGYWHGPVDVEVSEAFAGGPRLVAGQFGFDYKVRIVTSSQADGGANLAGSIVSRLARSGGNMSCDIKADPLPPEGGDIKRRRVVGRVLEVRIDLIEALRTDGSVRIVGLFGPDGQRIDRILSPENAKGYLMDGLFGPVLERPRRDPNPGAQPDLMHYALSALRTSGAYPAAWPFRSFDPNLPGRRPTPF